jgi:membrane protein implicated in regulation of membrane protease activity
LRPRARRATGLKDRDRKPTLGEGGERALVIYAYVVSLTLGAILLAVQLVGHGHDVASHGHAGDPSDSALASFLSLRTASFVLAFTGAAGLLLSWAGVGVTLAAGLAAGVGLASGAIAAWVFRRAVTSAGGSTPPLEIRGRSAEVLVPFGKGTSGLVRIQVDGRTTDLIAETDEDDIESGEEVLILDAQGASARVTRSPLSEGRAPPKERDK